MTLGLGDLALVAVSKVLTEEADISPGLLAVAYWGGTTLSYIHGSTSVKAGIPVPGRETGESGLEPYREVQQNRALAGSEIVSDETLTIGEHGAKRILCIQETFVDPRYLGYGNLLNLWCGIKTGRLPGIEQVQRAFIDLADAGTLEMFRPYLLRYKIAAHEEKVLHRVTLEKDQGMRELTADPELKQTERHPFSRQKASSGGTFVAAQKVEKATIEVWQVTTETFLNAKLLLDSESTTRAISQQLDALPSSSVKRQSIVRQIASVSELAVTSSGQPINLRINGWDMSRWGQPGTLPASMEAVNIDYSRSSEHLAEGMDAVKDLREGRDMSPQALEARGARVVSGRVGPISFQRALAERESASFDTALEKEITSFKTERDLGWFRTHEGHINVTKQRLKHTDTDVLRGTRETYVTDQEIDPKDVTTARLLRTMDQLRPETRESHAVVRQVETTTDVTETQESGFTSTRIGSVDLGSLMGRSVDQVKLETVRESQSHVTEYALDGDSLSGTVSLRSDREILSPQALEAKGAKLRLDFSTGPQREIDSRILAERRFEDGWGSYLPVIGGPITTMEKLHLGESLSKSDILWTTLDLLTVPTIALATVLKGGAKVAVNQGAKAFVKRESMQVFPRIGKATVSEQAEALAKKGSSRITRVTPSSGLDRGNIPGGVRAETQMGLPQSLDVSVHPEARMRAPQRSVTAQSGKDPLKASSPTPEIKGIAEREALKTTEHVRPYGNRISQYVRSPEELDVYRRARIQETVVNGRPCLVKNNIDLKIKDPFGRTNFERMKLGQSPLDATGRPLELHHIGQHPNGPLAELTYVEHRGAESFAKLHARMESQIDRLAFDKLRAAHWMERANEIERELARVGHTVTP